MVSRYYAKPTKVTLDADLTAVAGLTGTGLVERTGTDAMAIRALGVGTTAAVPTRADADARYAAIHAILTAMVGLSPATDKLPYFTSAIGAMAVATFTAAARTFVAAVDAAAQRTAMGLGTAATSASTAFEASGAVSTHAGGSSVHAIASTTGLQAALDAKQAITTLLTSIVGVSPVADRGLHFTSSTAAAVHTQTAAARTFAALSPSVGQVIVCNSAGVWSVLAKPSVLSMLTCDGAGALAWMTVISG